MRQWHVLLALAPIALVAGCSKEEAATNQPAPADIQAPAPEPTEPEAKTIAVGTDAPSITVANSHNWEGDLPQIENYKGKVVVLDFWAYW